MKFTAKKCTWNGNNFRSMFERDIFKGMHTRLKRLLGTSSRVSKIMGYEADWLHYTLEDAYYNPDITLKKSDGTKMFIECKGFYHAADRKKMKAVKKHNPTADIRFVFMKNGKVGKKMTYGRWAELNGFPFAFKSVPQEWLREVEGVETPTAK